MHPSTHLQLSGLARGRQGSLRVSTDPSPLADDRTDRPPPEQTLVLVPQTPPATSSAEAALAPEPVEEDFEEISYDELRLSLCPADTTHFAPVFGEYAPTDRSAIVMRPRIQTTNAHIIPPSSPALAPRFVA